MSSPEDPPREHLPCPGCGYDLRGAPHSPRQTAVTCPECGTNWLRRQLTENWRPLDDEPRLGRWGLTAAFSPVVLSFFAVGLVLIATDNGNAAILTAFLSVVISPVILLPLGCWRYRHHLWLRKRIPRVAAFVLCYLFFNLLLIIICLIALMSIVQPRNVGV